MDAGQVNTNNKWEKIEKQIDKEEKINELDKKDYDQEVKDNIHKMMGCNKDHAVELDIYNKSYKEKIDRIKLMKEQGNVAIAEYNKMQTQGIDKNASSATKPEDMLNKASYYYAQALLIFVYLIPDTDKEEKESNELKISCHLNQSLSYMKLKRYDDCLNELENVLHRLDKNNTKALYRKAQVLELLGKHVEAMKVIDQFYAANGSDETSKDGKAFAALKQSISKKIGVDNTKSKELAQKMVQGNNNSNASNLSTAASSASVPNQA